MKRIFKKHNDVTKLLLLIGIFAVIFIVLCLLKTDVDICEWWTKTIARGFIWLSGHLTNWVGISFFELFVIFAIPMIALSLGFLVFNLVRRNNKKALKFFLGLVCFAMVFVTMYTACASFGYNRKALPFDFLQVDVTQEEVFLIAENYVSKLNEVSARLPKDENGAVVSPYTTKELSDLLKKEYEKLDAEEFDGYFNKFTPRGKNSLFSWLMTEMHVVGLFFAPTGEVHVNSVAPTHELAITMAHEMAHGKGVMREDDANLLAYYIALSSDDDYVLFSGLYVLLGQILSAVRYFPNSQPLYEGLMQDVSIDVKKTSNFSNQFWTEHDLLKEIEEFFNNQYLKANGVENGTDSYQENNKADITVDEDTLDDYDQPIVEIVSYSRTQKLIFAIAKSWI